MCAVLVVVANILREPAFQVAFVNCDDVIQEITPDDHSEDQFLNLLRRLSSPDRPPDLGDQLPVQTESGPVPTHHRFGRDHNEGLLPSGPKSTNGDPEQLVEQV